MSTYVDIIPFTIISFNKKPSVWKQPAAIDVLGKIQTQARRFDINLNGLVPCPYGSGNLTDYLNASASRKSPAGLLRPL